MVERGGLENRYTRKGIVSSNLTPADMDTHVVDLRKNSEQETLRPEPLTAPVLGAPTASGAKREEIAGAILSWVARDHEKRERKPLWYVFFMGAAGALVLIGILTKSYLFIAFVILASLVIFMYIKRESREVGFAITRHGISIGTRIRAFSEFKSFQVKDIGGVRELSLETARGLTPYLKIPLGLMRPEPVRRALLSFLAEAEHKELATDEIARALGL